MVRTMKAETRQVYQERILRVLVHIQQHLDEDIRLEDLAALAHFSPYHFHRIFRGMVGESLKEHIRRLRLERAAGRLRHSRWCVTEVAFDAGYETHEAFTRSFRDMFGVCPSLYRSNHRSQSLPEVPCKVHFGLEGETPCFQPIALGGQAMNVQIKRIEPMRVAFMRNIGPYSSCKHTWDKFMTWVGPKGLITPQTVFLGICHDDPEVTPPEKIRYDACMTVDEDFSPQGDVGVQVIPGGDYAVMTHIGPYDNLGDTFAAICGQWGPQSGREFRSSPCFEIYFNSPDDTKPQDLRTDVYVPLEPLNQ